MLKREKYRMIGIVGGVGPYAGLDLNRRIFDNTLTDGTDQDHLEVLLFSASRRVSDRTAYLLGEEERNPADGLFEAVEALAAAGAEVVAIACNTAHSPRIMGRLEERIAEKKLGIELVDMIGETARFVASMTLKADSRIGLLATRGTIETGVFDRVARGLEENELITPDPEQVERVHEAIYHREWGIKARSNPVSARARDSLGRAVEHLAARGANAVILGCTELPLAFPERYSHGVELIDPTAITARALIGRVAPKKLRPLE